MLKKLLNFIFSIRYEGIYCYTTILGIKIVTKPLHLKIENKLIEIDNKLNNIYPFIIDRNNDIHRRFDELYPFFGIDLVILIIILII